MEHCEECGHEIKPAKSITLIDALNRFIKAHGGNKTKAAKALNVHPTYIYHMLSQAKANPSKEIFRKLGIRKVAYFEDVAAERVAE